MLRSSDAFKLAREWKILTGDSFIVDVRPMYGEIDGFLETFKYALKFSDLELSDNLHAYKTLKGKRLINSFGALREVRESPKNWPTMIWTTTCLTCWCFIPTEKGQATISLNNGQKISPMCTHYTLLCKVVRSYKTITLKLPQRPPKQYGVFSFRCETATKCQGRRSRAFHPWHLAKPIHSAKG